MQESIVRPRATGFTSVLVLGMTAGTMVAVSFGVLSRPLIDDLGISRSAVGGLLTALALVGAVASPLAGRFTDRLGGRTAIIYLFGIATATMLGVAASPTYFVLLAVAAVAGLAQALANPATNKLITHHIQVGRRGVITGLKQSGVQLGVVLAGILLPLGAVTIGWRLTMALGAVLPLAALAAAVAWVPRSVRDPVEPRRSVSQPLPVGVWWLSAYATAMGLGGGALLAYLPLFSQEAVGMTVTEAGLVFGVAGLAAVAGRIGWGAAADRLHSYPALLLVLSVLSVTAIILLIAAPSFGAVLVWAGALLAAASSGSWNSVAMLAVMEESGAAQAGRASGIVLFGFLAGLGVGPPIFGYSVDVTGSYAPGLWTVAAVFTLAAGVAVAWLITSGSRDHS